MKEVWKKWSLIWAPTPRLLGNEARACYGLDMQYALQTWGCSLGARLVVVLFWPLGLHHPILGSAGY